jgi:hypothetical protein
VSRTSSVTRSVDPAYCGLFLRVGADERTRWPFVKFGASPRKAVALFGEHPETYPLRALTTWLLASGLPVFLCSAESGSGVLEAGSIRYRPAAARFFEKPKHKREKLDALESPGSRQSVPQPTRIHSDESLNPLPVCTFT